MLLAPFTCATTASTLLIAITLDILRYEGTRQEYVCSPGTCSVHGREYRIVAIPTQAEHRSIRA